MAEKLAELRQKGGGSGTDDYILSDNIVISSGSPASTTVTFSKPAELVCIAPYNINNAGTRGSLVWKDGETLYSVNATLSVTGVSADGKTLTVNRTQYNTSFIAYNLIRQ